MPVINEKHQLALLDQWEIVHKPHSSFLKGTIYADPSGKYEDGELAVTEQIMQVVQEHAVTRNAIYRLGKKTDSLLRDTKTLCERPYLNDDHRKLIRDLIQRTEELTELAEDAGVNL